MKTPTFRIGKLLICLSLSMMLSGALAAQTPDTNMLIPLVDELNPNLERVLNHHLNVSKSRLRWTPHKYNILIYIFPDQDVINCLSEKVIDSIYKVNDFRRIKTLNSYSILAETVKKDDVELANIPRFKTICLYQYKKWNVFFLSDLEILFHFKEEYQEVSIPQDRQKMTAKKIGYSVYRLNPASLMEMKKLR